MSQRPRFARARQLTASVLPGRRPEDPGSLAVGRLHKIAAGNGTGVLPFTGRYDGAVYFRGGKVVSAESGRTPGPAAAAQAALAGDVSALGRITALLAVAEPTVDAALELLSGEYRPTRFRPSDDRPAGLARGIALDVLLAEVARRQRIVGQLSAVLTADTPLVRHLHLRSESIRVSALQWALLIRVQPGSTPRDLAWDLNRSVFGTTVDVHRLLTLRLLSVASQPVASPPVAGQPVHGQPVPGLPAGDGRDEPGDVPGRDLAAVSFVRAISLEEGDGMSVVNAGAVLGAGD